MSSREKAVIVGTSSPIGVVDSRRPNVKIQMGAAVVIVLVPSALC